MSSKPPAPPSTPPPSSSVEGTPDHTERRRFRRVRLQVRVTATGASNLYAGVSNDISEGGVFLATQVAPPIGTLVDLTLVLGGDGVFEVHGVVRWERVAGPGVDGPSGVGIQFLDLTAGDRARLQEFMARRDTLLWED